MDIKPIKIESLKDLPEAPISQGTTLVRKTGSWKNVRPVMGERSAPCENACPLKVRIPKFIDHLTKNDPEKAAYSILSQNPFPTITGRLCPAKCEVGCNRNKYDEKISIRELERFLGDYLIDKKYIPAHTKIGKKALIFGSTLSSMSAAYALLSKGYDVIVISKTGKSFEDIRDRLPETMVQKEENILLNAGLELKAGDISPVAELVQNYDVILITSSYLTEDIKVEDPKTGRTNINRVYVLFEDQDISKAIKNALNTASFIEALLKGEEYKEEKLPRVVSFKEIVTDYFNHENAISEIREMGEAIREALRCFSCGTCNSCGNCYVFCPDTAVKWIDNFPVFDYDYCKGCGVCVNECPRGVLELVPEK